MRRQFDHHTDDPGFDGGEMDRDIHRTEQEKFLQNLKMM